MSRSKSSRISDSGSNIISNVVQHKTDRSGALTGGLLVIDHIAQGTVDITAASLGLPFAAAAIVRRTDW